MKTTIWAHCPKCQTELKIDTDETELVQIECPDCHKVFAAKVPPRSAAPLHEVLPQMPVLPPFQPAQVHYKPRSKSNDSLHPAALTALIVVCASAILIPLGFGGYYLYGKLSEASQLAMSDSTKSTPSSIASTPKGSFSTPTVSEPTETVSFRDYSAPGSATTPTDFAMNLREIGPALDSSALKKLEELCGYKLPPDYTKFLTKTNGGVFEGFRYVAVPGGDTVAVDVLAGLGKGVVHDAFTWFPDMNGRAPDLELPPGYIPVAFTPGGDPFVISMVNEVPGVYFLDDQGFFKKSRNKTNAYFVAPTFSEFLKRLRPTLKEAEADLAASDSSAKPVGLVKTKKASPSGLAASNTEQPQLGSSPQPDSTVFAAPTLNPPPLIQSEPSSPGAGPMPGASTPSSTTSDSSPASPNPFGQVSVSGAGTSKSGLPVPLHRFVGSSGVLIFVLHSKGHSVSSSIQELQRKLSIPDMQIEGGSDYTTIGIRYSGTVDSVAKGIQFGRVSYADEESRSIHVQVN